MLLCGTLKHGTIQAQRSAPPPKPAPAPAPVRTPVRTPAPVRAPVSPPRSLQKIGVGLQLETNANGECEIAYVVPGFAAEESQLFGVFDKILSINGTDVSGNRAWLGEGAGTGTPAVLLCVGRHEVARASSNPARAVTARAGSWGRADVANTACALLWSVVCVCAGMELAAIKKLTIGDEGTLCTLVCQRQPSRGSGTVPLHLPVRVHHTRARQRAQIRGLCVFPQTFACACQRWHRRHANSPETARAVCGTADSQSPDKGGRFEQRVHAGCLQVYVDRHRRRWM